MPIYILYEIPLPWPTTGYEAPVLSALNHSYFFLKVEIELDRQDCSKMAISSGGEYNGEKIRGKENYRI